MATPELAARLPLCPASWAMTESWTLSAAGRVTEGHPTALPPLPDVSACTCSSPGVLGEGLSALGFGGLGQTLISQPGACRTVGAL